MTDRLPPLFTLQAFEAAARLESFSRAAHELHLTPGAISRQIRQLEDWSGLALFERRGPKVALTGDGAALLARLVAPLALLHEAVFPAPEEAPRVLQVATLASIATEWLLPRLATFHQRHPGIRLAIQTGYDLVRPPPRVPMVAIRHTAATRDRSSETLFDDRLVAVCSPGLRGGLGADPRAWPARTLLQHLTQDPRDWCAAAGLPDDWAPQGMAFNDAEVLLNAAQAGFGVALTRLSIAWHRLEAGALVLACGTACVAPRENRLVVREDCRQLPEVSAFCDWLREEARQWRTTQAAVDAQLASGAWESVGQSPARPPPPPAHTARARAKSR